MILSKCFLDDEIEFIRSFLDSVVHDVLNKFDRDKRCTVNKCPVFLRLLYISSRGEKFAKYITAAVGKCYFSAAAWVIFLTRTTFVSMRKYVLPLHHINSVMYKYTSSCGSDYIDSTSSLLACILNLELKRCQLVNTYGSSKADHMINSRKCMADFNVDRLTILSGSYSLYYLKCLRPFTFHPFNLPSVYRGTVCWGWMWSVSNHLLIFPISPLFFFSPLLYFFLHYIPPFNFSGVNSFRGARRKRSYPTF